MQRIALLAVGLFFGASAFAQQDPHFTMYMFNKQAINPGYVGSIGTTALQALGRYQWAGIEGAPQTITFSAQGLAGKARKIALGLNVFNDRLGVDNHTGAYLQYAYHAQVNDNTTLSIGLQAGATQYRAKLSELLQPTWAYPKDPILAHDKITAWLPNFGAGAYLWNDAFYIGLSVPHMINNLYDRERVVPDSIMAKQYRHYFLFGGIKFRVSDHVAIQPHAMVKYAAGNNVSVPVSTDLSLSFIFKNIIMLGVAHRLNDSFDAFLKAQLTRNLSIGYAYDYIISELSNYSSGSHEVMLGWEFGKALEMFKGPRLWTF